jgi:hypothetical protein
VGNAKETQNATTVPHLVCRDRQRRPHVFHLDAVALLDLLAQLEGFGELVARLQVEDAHRGFDFRHSMWIKQQPSAPKAVANVNRGWNAATAHRRTSCGGASRRASLATAISSAESNRLTITLPFAEKAQRSGETVDEVRRLFHATTACGPLGTPRR